MNSFLLTLAALLILVLGALFAAPLVVDWNDYRPAFEAQATKLLGREVKVGGKVHMVVLPAPELRFDDVKVAGADGNFEQPFLAAKSFEAWLNIGSLMTGTIEARKITLTNPVMRLELNADGSGDWADIGRPGEALPFVPKEVLLDSVSVTNGRIELVKDGAPAVVLDNVEGEASAASLTGPYKVTTTYDFKGRRQELRFSTSAADPSGLFHLKSALRDPDRSTVYLLDGEVTGLDAKPAFNGNVIVRVARAPSAETPPPPAEVPPPVTTDIPDAVSPEEAALTAADNASALELKGELSATPGRAELPNFELTIHAKGRPQMLKGKLALEFGEQPKAEGELSAGWIDIDMLLAATRDKANAQETEVSPAAALTTLAETALKQAASLQQGNLKIAIEQASLGGDLVGEIDLDLSASGGKVEVAKLSAKLPGENKLEASGVLASGEAGPVFSGPIKLDGSKLKTLTRWASGDRSMSGQATVGAFALAGDLVVGGGTLKLDNATGELSGTKFTGALNYSGGAKRAIDVTLDSDRLDLKAVLGDDVAWRSWLPSSAMKQEGAVTAEPNLLAALRDDQLHVTLRVGELLLPNIPPGRLDANFSLAQDTLDVAKLDFAAADALSLTGNGRIEHVSAAPSGRVDFALNAADAASLRVAADLIGLSPSIAHSKHLASLAPLDIAIGLSAGGEGNTAKTSLDVTGKAGGSDVVLKGEANGEPAKLADAHINLTATISGDRPQAVLGLLLPDVADDKLAVATAGQGKLTVELRGVPKTDLTGRLALETPAMTIAFDGSGALKDDGMALTGKGSAASSNAALALMLLGLEASPGATDIPLNLHADIVKTAQIIDLKAISGDIAGEPVQGDARFDLGGDKTRFSVDAKTGTVSLPVLLGALVAWRRTPSTEEMLGAVGASAADVWPARGFALGPLENSEGEIKLIAKTLTLGAPFRVADAVLTARVDKDGLAITQLNGKLFGGTLAASGKLSPRGAGAELQAQAELKGGKLDLLSKSVAGSVLAKGPFALSFNVSGEGLSPPGLVAGLSGEGSFSLEPGVVQTLTPEPLRRIAVEAAKTKKIKDKDQITQLTKSVRDRLTKGTYKYTATTLQFEVKNGTLRFKPATLASKGAETAINGYVELASLRLDSEWEMRLQGSGDVPAVSLVFAGPLSDAGTISPAIDTEAIESYLTVRRMQEDVERLENLDVSGRAPPPDEPQAEAAPEPEPALPDEAEAAPASEPEPKAEATPPTPPAPKPIVKKEKPAAPHAADLEPKHEAPAPAPAPAPPSAAKQETPPRSADLDPAKPAVPAEVAPQPALPWQSEAKPEQPAAAETPGTPTETTTSGEADASSAAAAGGEIVPPVAPKPAPKPKRRAPAPDDWKKGIGIFGGG